MDNHNTFNPPVDTGASTPPIESTEPVTPSETPEEEPKNGTSTEFGPTSNYNGYGTDENGYDVEKNDLGPDYYNAQARRGAEALYAAAEKEQINEEKAAFPDWYGDKEDIEKAQHELLSEALTALRELRAISEESQKKVNAEIEKVERIMATMQNPEPPTPPTGGTPVANVTNSESSTKTGASTSETIHTRDITDLGSMDKSAAEKDLSNTRYRGKDGINYHSREDAIASFQD